MKKQISLFAFSILAILGKAQNSNVEKNISGIQIGLFGLDLYNETKIADKTTLRAEASLFPAIWGGDMYAKTGFAFYPALTVQPKYYYNISKRAENGKNTNTPLKTKRPKNKSRKSFKMPMNKGEKLILQSKRNYKLIVHNYRLNTI